MNVLHMHDLLEVVGINFYLKSIFDLCIIIHQGQISHPFLKISELHSVFVKASQ